MERTYTQALPGDYLDDFLAQLIADASTGGEDAVGRFNGVFLVATRESSLNSLKNYYYKQAPPIDPNSDEMADRGDYFYTIGERFVWRKLLAQCLAELGYGDDLTREKMVDEREAVIAQLRDVCHCHGDNDWPENLHLADVIEKHLARHLHASKADASDTPR